MMIRIGAMIDGKYEVTGILGRGGMGIVVEARHLRLDTLVAIKFMRTDMIALSGGVERFLREARALVKLKSHHAVKVYDQGIHARMPFIVMEHLEGTDMQTVLDQKGRLEPAEIARHLRQACEAIAEAHSMGIYHRDLKPANLFLSRGASGRIIVKVLDFGIAKILQTHPSSAYVTLTGAKTMMGTLHYMSPEQLVSAKDIDGRADIWSLGVILYQLATGALPFDDDNGVKLQRRIRCEPPQAKPLPPTLAPIIHRCLQKNREDRYPTIVDLALALRPLIHESLSPFGSLPARKDPMATLPDKPRVLPAALDEQAKLAMAEGIVPGIASDEPEPTTVRRFAKQGGFGETLLLEPKVQYALTVQQRVERPTVNFAQTLLAPSAPTAPISKTSHSLTSLQLSPMTPHIRLPQPHAASGPPRAIAIGIAMLSVAFVAFVVVFLMVGALHCSAFRGTR